MQYAPKPKLRNTLQYAVVDVVVSMGGATRKDVMTYLPTVYDKTFSREQVDAALSNGVYRGYLITDHVSGLSRIYRRAPMEYYQARNKKAKAQQRKSKRKATKAATTKMVDAAVKPPVRPTEVRKPFVMPDKTVRLRHTVDRETAITWALVTFIGGLGIGLALGGLL